MDAKRSYLKLADYFIPCRAYNYLTGISAFDNYNYPNLYDKKIISINPKISRLLEYTQQTAYDDNSVEIASERKYTYDNYNQLIEERTSSSDESYYFVKHFRVTDFITPPLQAHLDMLSKHIHTPVIEEVAYINNSNTLDGNEKIISGKYSVLENFNGNVYPKINYRLDISSPHSPSAISVFDDSGFDAQFYKPKVHFLSYNVTGDILATKKENGFETYYKYSNVSNSLLIAQAQNAASDEIFYSSFEKDHPQSDFQGYHSHDFLPVTNQGLYHYDAKTGGLSVDLNLSNIEQTDIKIGKYVLSFWTKELASLSQIINVTGTNINILKQHISVATPNGWMLNHYVIEITALSEVMISGNALIDELRMHPYDAQLKTYTYYFNNGQIRTITDENNLTTYYNYDKVHRLESIKDANRNLLEERKYHTMNLQDNNY